MYLLKRRKYLTLFFLFQESNLVINKISSGDPVRGNMAVDTTMDLKEGQFVKVFNITNSIIIKLDLLISLSLSFFFLVFL